MSTFRILVVALALVIGSLVGATAVRELRSPPRTVVEPIEIEGPEGTESRDKGPKHKPGRPKQESANTGARQADTDPAPAGTSSGGEADPAPPPAPVDDDSADDEEDDDRDDRDDEGDDGGDD